MLRLFFVLFLLTPVLVHAQLLPKEGSQLNYRIIGFTFPATLDPGPYTIEIAMGNYNNADSFNSNIIKTVTSKTNKTIIEVPAFAREYTWRYKGKDQKATGLHHFSTYLRPCGDTAVMRLRVVQEAEMYKDAYIFTDNNRTMYNMKGEPVWFLPNVANRVDEHSDLRDIKLTPTGTITFINSEMAYEINYGGDILWEANYKGKVNKDKSEFYHHELTKLSNGHYMVLGNEFVAVPRENTGGSNMIKMIQFGTVIEYDKQGNVIWSWKASTHFKDVPYIYRKWPSGRQENTMHQNSFYFDEKKKNLYVSFKNTNQVVKIKYPEGKILNIYGKPYVPDDEENHLFCDQHSVKLNSKGNLMLFNNNMCNWTEKPKVVVFKEPPPGNNKLEKIWEYEAPAEVTTVMDKGRDIYYTSGGNAIELPDGSLFISMCNHYVNLFIIDRDKKIRWNAIPEKSTEDHKQWLPATQYRASIITAKQMEKLVWSVQ
ncbi:MAG: hypothetical protein K0Q79_1542 [Flavipsychrobacter sp.]|jgi:hypothetical protein|nr:hypothetical protein [Flavipsychrobacter sp.]